MDKMDKKQAKLSYSILRYVCRFLRNLFLVVRDWKRRLQFGQDNIILFDKFMLTRKSRVKIETCPGWFKYITRKV